jgi:preprotein translocase subunit SecE
VARDRQRAKQRRAKRQPGAGGPAAGSASTRARDIGLDQADADDAGLGNTTPPEPTKHAMPDVEQARLAEAGPARLEPGEVDDDLAEGVYADELEDDEPAAAPAAAPAATRRAPREARPQRRGPFGRLIAFLGHCIDELRRVQWPDRRQVGQGTAVVLGFVVLAGGYLGLLDAIWKPLIDAIL